MEPCVPECVSALPNLRAWGSPIWSNLRDSPVRCGGFRTRAGRVRALVLGFFYGHR
jgi:hypothetical protein